MDFNALRSKHPEFVYENFDYEAKDGVLKVKFHFILSPDIDFYPTLEMPVSGSVGNIDKLVFNLGLVEIISYWKAACPPKIVIKAGRLNDEQKIWWKDLFINGLGEFFYQNKIDFCDIVTIECRSTREYGISPRQELRGDLILVGGGKDSAVTAEFLSREGAFLLNPTPAALKIARIAGFKNTIIAKRTIDPELLQLNEQGYLNGHTPFSAYLAFVATLVANIYGYKNIIVSNEQSAGEANLEYLGLMVNHQYSKSFDFEKKFRDYSNKYLSETNYFSFLRPLNELQIAMMFLQIKKYDQAFKSCNAGRGEYWCGECAKCAFSYLIFSALADKARIRKIFGEKDFFENEKISGYIKDLTGKGIHKPLDCVGTEEESQMAQKLLEGSERDKKEIFERIKNDWNNEHFLPEEYETILRDKINRLSFRP